MLTKLINVVTRTTLETSSASLSYFVARIATLTAAGIAESSITTDRNTPSKLRILTERNPNANPTPTRKHEAKKVVGSEASFTLERLCPNTIKTRGMDIREMRSSVFITSSGGVTLSRL